MSKIILVVGPTCSGKTTLLNKFFSENTDENYVNIISTTTRLYRHGEKDGEHYNFISHEEFKHSINAGHFVEYEEINGNMYGSHIDEWLNIMEDEKQERKIIKIVDIKGAQKLKHFFQKDVKVIYIDIKTPGVIYNRLVERNTPDAEIAMRMAEYRECNAWKTHANYVLLNEIDEFDVTYNIFKAIIHNV